MLQREIVPVRDDRRFKNGCFFGIHFIANLRILNGFAGKKRNVISKKGRQGRLEVFQKNIHICGDGHP